MTVEEKNELECAIFYRHFKKIEGALEDCDDASVALYIGRVIGIMQETLREWPTEEENGGAN